MNKRLRVIGQLGLITLFLVPMTVCSDREQSQLRSQVKQEQAKRIEAENAARDATGTRNIWIAVIGGASAVGFIIFLLVGIAIGTRASAAHTKEESNDGFQS